MIKIQNKDIDILADIILKAEEDEREDEAMSFRAVVDKHESLFEKALKKMFDQQKNEIISKLNPKKDMADFYMFDMRIWILNFQKVGLEHMTAAMQDNGQRVFDDLKRMGKSYKQIMAGITFDMEYPEAILFLETQALKLAEEVNAVTEKQVREVLQQGFAEGLPVDVIAENIEVVFAGIDTTRALMIARTEISRAANIGAVSAYKQSGVVYGKEWLTAQDERVCIYCNEMDRKVESLNENFLNVGGSLPVLDDDGKTRTLRNNYLDVIAPPIHARCLTKNCLVSSSSGISAMSKRWYDGNVFIFKTASGREFSCTPNHPILTSVGFVRADSLNIGSQVVAHGLCNGKTFSDWKNINKPATAENIAKSFFNKRFVVTKKVPVTSPDFHGDGRGSKVAIIGTNGLLLNGFYTSFRKFISDNDFIFGYAKDLFFNRFGTLAFSGPRHNRPYSSGMRGFGLFKSLLFRHLTPFKSFGFALVSSLNSILKENPSNNIPADTKVFSNSVFGRTGDVKIDNFSTNFVDDFICHKSSQKYNDYVYNFQTPASYYIMGGIASHNCRCTILPVLREI